MLRTTMMALRRAPQLSRGLAAAAAPPSERELQAIAEAEGTELPTIQRKVLKTGREIWTIGEPPTDQAEEEW